MKLRLDFNFSIQRHPSRGKSFPPTPIGQKLNAMKRNRLGKSAIWVSDICLGTMSFGSWSSEEESFRILDKAFDAGIDFLDTAEIYPVPPKTEYVHESERIIGKWLKSKPREAIILATKVTGPSHAWFNAPVRTGRTGFDRHQIRTAIEGSLERLGVDYVDLYQTHWPDHDFGYEETLTTLDELVQSGMVRIIGSSNENAWGMMKAQHTSEALGTARYETIQNNFSLINRRFEDELANICRRESISLIPYSPLGGGVLTGKYNQPTPPGNARFSEYMKSADRQKKMAHRFVNERSLATVEALKPIAESLGISLTTLATAWSKQHDFVASTIIGVRTAEQLDDILAAADLEISAETLTRIDEISLEHPYPLG